MSKDSRERECNKRAMSVRGSRYVDPGRDFAAIAARYLIGPHLSPAGPITRLRRPSRGGRKPQIERTAEAIDKFGLTSG